MGQTLDRMRRFSTSLSNVEGREGTAAGAAESEKVDVHDKYKRTYREVSGGDQMIRGAGRTVTPITGQLH